MLKNDLVSRSRRGAATVVIGAMAIAMAGCSQGGTAAGGDGSVSVVAELYPFAFLADRIGGDSAEVTTLVEGSSSPHSFELSPKQVTSIASADVVVYESSFVPSVDDAIAQENPDAAFDVVSDAKLIEASGEEHDDHEEHGDEADFDPHLWLNFDNMITIARQIGDRLTEADPDNADQYQTNLDAVVADLTQMKSDYETGLQTCERRIFLTDHAAFGYLADEYDLKQLGLSGLNDEDQVSPARLAEIQKQVSADGITTLLRDPRGSKDSAETIAGDLGVDVGILDPIPTLSDESPGSDYLEVMQSNLESLRKANECQ